MNYPELKFYYEPETIRSSQRLTLIGYAEVFNMDIETGVYGKPITIVSEGRHFIPLVIETIIDAERTSIGVVFTYYESELSAFRPIGNNVLESVISGKYIAVLQEAGTSIVWTSANEL